MIREIAALADASTEAGWKTPQLSGLQNAQYMTPEITASPGHQNWT